jgi:hypothetical protein
MNQLKNPAPNTRLDAREPGGLPRGRRRDERRRRQRVQLDELGRVGLAAEHVEHALRDREAAADVDRRGGDGRARERVRGARRHEAAAREDEAAHSGEAGDRVGDRHQRRVERGRDAPDGLR